MNRYALMAVRNWYKIPGWAVRCAYGNWKREKFSHGENYDYVRKMIKRINKTGRITVQVSGEENLPKDGGYVLFPNHQGFFDSLALVEACRGPFYLVAMKEVMEIPFLKYLFALFEVKLMDRADLRQSFSVIAEVSEEVKMGRRYVIFAEGTLEKEENTVMSMKPGAFKAAVKAKAPVVPVMLKDSFRVFERPGIKPVTVQVKFLKPLYEQDYRGMHTAELAKLTEQRITEELNSY